MADELARVRRMWIRTPDGRWAPIPYGAGEDVAIRSLNVWDGQKWLTPIGGYQALHRNPGKLQALDVYEPSLNWDEGGTHTYNPNFVYKNTSAQWSPAHADWLRLMYLDERNDPDWRVVSIFMPIPTKVPNVTVNHSFYANGPVNPATADQFKPENAREDLGFWPSFNYYYAGGQVDYQTQNVPINLSGTAMGSGLAIFTGMPRARNYLRDTPDGSDYEQGGLFIEPPMVRDRLIHDYSQRDLFLRGQYQPIAGMDLKRIYFTFQVDLTFSVQGSTRLPDSAFDNLTVELLHDTDVPSTAYTGNSTGGWQLSYNLPQNQAAGYEARGTVFKTITSTDFTRNRDEGGGVYEYKFYYREIFGLTIDTPTEPDNIYFSIRVPNRVGGGTVNLNSAELFADGCSFQYAVAGKDVPQEYRTTTLYR